MVKMQAMKWWVAYLTFQFNFASTKLRQHHFVSNGYWHRYMRSSRGVSWTWSYSYYKTFKNLIHWMDINIITYLRMRCFVIFQFKLKLLYLWLSFLWNKDPSLGLCNSFSFLYQYTVHEWYEIFHWSNSLEMIIYSVTILLIRSVITLIYTFPCKIYANLPLSASSWKYLFVVRCFRQ